MGQSSESFDEHERPTAQRSRPEGGSEGGDDPNATTRIKPFDLEQLVAKGSGTRPVITPEQLDRYMKERTAPSVEIDERLTEPAPEASTENGGSTERDDVRERETVDALTLQRETLIIKAPENGPPMAPQAIPIDVDLSRLEVHIPSVPPPRPAAGRPVPFTARIGSRLDRRQLTIAGGFLIAMISALLGFIAGRL